jgi:membrane protein DedA with SNARE-associated domain
MNDNTRKKWLPLGILAVALVLWAGMFALGAYLQLGADEPKHDLRKPLIIMGGMAAFLAVWGAALWRRSRRPKK